MVGMLVAEHVVAPGALPRSRPRPPLTTRLPLAAKSTGSGGSVAARDRFEASDFFVVASVPFERSLENESEVRILSDAVLDF